MRSLYFGLLFLGCFCLFFACKDDKVLKSGMPKTQHGEGVVTVLVDETLLPAIQPEVVIYENDNPNADIRLVVVKETEGVRRLVMGRDTSPLLFIGRMLKPDELKPLNNVKVTPHYVRIARDAVALGIHKTRKGTQANFEAVQGVLSGKLTTWGQLQGTADNEKITLVYDRQGSGIVQYALDLNDLATLPSNAYAVNSTDEAIAYVEAHPSAIALLDWSFFSDSDNKKSLARREKIDWMHLSPRDTLQNKEFFGPYPMDVGLELYPLMREIYAVNIEGYNGLATGFVNFMTSERGQRILLRAGLVPSKTPGRQVQYNTGPRPVIID